VLSLSKILRSYAAERERSKEKGLAAARILGERAAEDQEKKSLPLRDAAAYRGTLTRAATRGLILPERERAAEDRAEIIEAAAPSKGV